MIMTRLQANEEILKRLGQIVQRNPNWRFHQILQNYNVENPGVDQWYEESTITLTNLEGSMD